ncbi:MAG: PspC domain-containing protein [Melioribacteraceae bacterium]|nr:PspC domain-containing protein [Melioribacteraceae bacterium]
MEENNFPDIFDEKFDNEPPLQSQLKKLERSGSDKLITGVCAGIAKYFNAEPSIIRIIAMLTLLLGVWSVAAYLIASYLITKEQNPHKLSDEEKAIQKKINFRTVLSGTMILGGIYFGFGSFGFFAPWEVFIFGNSFLIPIIAIGFGIFLIIKFEKDSTTENKITSEKFYRSNTDKKIFGVCGGLAEYLNNIDTTTIRVLLLFGTILTLGLLAVGYILMALLIDYKERQTV